ncbi:hypothetical protein [Rickettsiella endosymbiont of Rhagonycha lignosa]|uniref:hypothetical protein n=1 Tax=Rickettsiella endosymbiont of Rhagonycha lignosa TaxID=3077937 RepID=UPI00313DF1CF
MISQLDEQAKRQLLLENDFDDDSNLLMKAAHYQPKAVKPLLELIASLDEETRRQIFLQKSYVVGNSLTLAALYQPKAIKLLLESIAQLGNRTILQIFLEGSCSSVSYSVIQRLAASEQTNPEVIQSIREFIDQQFIAQPLFKQDTLTQMFLQKDTGWKPLLATLLLNKYLADLARRKEQHITHLTKFFGCNFGYSTDEKEVAARELKTTLEKSGTIDHLLSLKKLYPALKNGRLGQLFATFCELETENNSLPAEISQQAQSLR